MNYKLLALKFFQILALALAFQSMNRKRVDTHEEVAIDFSLVSPGTMNEEYCIKTFLFSLSRCSVRPYEAIIVISGYNPLDPRARSFASDLTMIAQQLALSYVRLIFREGTQWQDSNRNYGASLTSRPFITFFDSDDVLHPDRFQVLSRFFSKNVGVEIALHLYNQFDHISNIKVPHINYSQCLQPMFPSDYVRRSWTAFLKLHPRYKFLWCCIGIKGHEKLQAHNAWGTMKRYVWESIPQKPVHRAEDSVQISDAIVAGFNFTVVNAILGFYRRRVNGSKLCSQEHQMDGWPLGVGPTVSMQGSASLFLEKRSHMPPPSIF